MENKLKACIFIWCVLCFFVFSATIAFKISTAPKEIDIDLIPNSSLIFSVFRVLPHYLKIDIELLIEKPIDNKQLGSYKTIGNWHDTSYLEFPNPGEPLMFNILINGSNIIYEALPAHYAGDRFFRQLVPFVDDGKPQIFPWPPSKSLSHLLQSGFNEIEVSVIEVDNKKGEDKAKVIVQPPIMLKSTSVNYKLLSYFYFWPLYVVLLLISGAALVIAYKNAIKSVRRTSVPCNTLLVSKEYE